jgi:uncharacterized protein (DUF362 family)
MSTENPTGAVPVVAVEPVEGDVRSAVRRALAAADWKRHVARDANVCLKVNLGWDLFIPGSITSPLVAEAVILEIRDHVGKIRVIEADQVLENVERAFHDSGMADVCRRTGVEWVNLSRSPYDTLDLPHNRVLRHVEIPRILRDTTLITLPVMKTHAKTRITGALKKNQWGCLNEMRHEHHLVLDDALADLNSIVRPALALMDGTVGLEGNGPKSGRPRVADRILCSADPVALDTVQAISMRIDPGTIVHLARCAERGIGTNDPSRIRIVGLDPNRDPVPFLPARHNAVSSVETLLRGSFAKWLFFDTPLFRICLLGAKAYYHAWTWARAGRIWREARAHPVYGPQWKPGWSGLAAAGEGGP